MSTRDCALPDVEEMRKALTGLFNDDDVIELRALFHRGRKRTSAGYFDALHRDELIRHAARLNNEGAAVYVTMNTLDPQLLGRYANRIEDFAQATATDGNIRRRRWLLLDFDPVRPTDTSGTQPQLEAAKAQARCCVRALRDEGWPDPVVVMSGNGVHLLYRLDLVNDDASRDLIKGALAGLAQRFDSDAVKLDRSVFNAGRIVKLPGTVANKGDHVPCTPWRVSRILHVPERLETVSPGQLQAAILATPPTGASFTRAALPLSRSQRSFDLDAFLVRLGIEYDQDRHDGRDRYKLARCPFNAEHGKGEAPIFRAADGTLGFKCQHSGCADKHWQDVRALMDGPREQRTTASKPARPERPGDTPAAEGRRTVDAETIARLAALPALEYERVRHDEAEKLGGVRVQTLDEQVKRARGNGTDEGGLMFAEVESWPDRVDGKWLLDSLAASARRFVILPSHGDTALALWVLFTHLTEAVDVAPILALLSPEKRCGKTTCLDWLSRLVRRPLPASNISSAALFRAVEAWGPTLLIDEADSFAKENEELRGILNSGHTRTTAYVVRTVGENHEPKAFSTWGAKLIALIGRLPDTLQDRAIPVELRRKLPSERVEKLRHAKPGEFDILARQCVRFAKDNAVTIGAARPKIPEELHDRAADNWEPLLAIADAAGGAWPRLAREAASALGGASSDGDSTKTELLQDIRALIVGRFDDGGRFKEGRFDGRDHVGSAELIEALTADREGRWCEFNRGEPLTQRQLARLLRQFGITSTTVRLEDGSGKTAKGYSVKGFNDDFARYLSPVDPSHRHNPTESSSYGASASVTEGAVLRMENSDNPLIEKPCDVVTDKNPLSHGKDAFEAF